MTDYPAELAPYADVLRGRSMLCRRLEMVPVECVARGYLTGSGFAEYQRTGAVCGHELPAGLRDGDRLPAPIFTPATKAERVRTTRTSPATRWRPPSGRSWRQSWSG